MTANGSVLFRLVLACVLTRQVLSCALWTILSFSCYRILTRNFHNTAMPTNWEIIEFFNKKAQFLQDIFVATAWPTSSKTPAHFLGNWQVSNIFMHKDAENLYSRPLSSIDQSPSLSLNFWPVHPCIMTLFPGLFGLIFDFRYHPVLCKKAASKVSELIEKKSGIRNWQINGKIENKDKI